MNDQLLAMPQWTTGARLLKLGEAVDFRFFLPAGVPASDLTIFPQYLERANPGAAFVAGGDLAWLDALESEQHALSFADGQATLTYRPPVPRQLPRPLAGRRRAVLPLLLGHRGRLDCPPLQRLPRFRGHADSARDRYSARPPSAHRALRRGRSALAAATRSPPAIRRLGSTRRAGHAADRQRGPDEHRRPGTVLRSDARAGAVAASRRERRAVRPHPRCITTTTPAISRYSPASA